MIPHFWFKRTKHNWSSISRTEYLSGYSLSDIFTTSLFRLRLNNIDESSPMRAFIRRMRWLIIQIILFTVGLKLTSNMSNLEIALQIFQDNTTIGWGNSAPSTWLRFLIEAPLGIWGIALVGLLITAWVDIINYTENLRRNGLMKNPYKNGIVIINFPGIERMNDLVQQLRHNGSLTPIFVVDEDMEELPASIRNLGNIELGRGVPFDSDVLADVKISEQNNIVIFPKDRTKASSDPITKSIVESVWEQGGNAKIIYYLVSEQNKKMFVESFKKQDNRPQPKSVMLNTATLVVAQEILNPGFSSVFQRLVRQDEGATPLIVTENFEGWTWSQLVISFMQTATEENMTCNAIALLQDGHTYECPKPGTILSKKSQILLSTDDDFNWNTFSGKMVKMR